MITVLVSPLIKLVTVALPNYLKEHGISETSQGLSNHNCPRLQHKSSGVFSAWEFSNVVGDNEEFEIEASGKYISNDDEGAMRMVLDGTSTIQHLDLAIVEHVNTSKSQLILEDWAVSFSRLRIYVSSRVRISSKARAFTGFMVKKRVRIES